MIGVRYTITLARTKLRSKRLMLALAVGVSGLLFGALYAATFAVMGISHSVDAFTRAAHDGKYLVKAQPVLPNTLFSVGGDSGLTKDIIRELKSLQASYTADRKAEAKRLGVPFDEQGVAAPLTVNPYADKNAPEEQRVTVNFESPVYQLYLSQLQADYSKTATNTFADLRKAATKYGATAFYQNDGATVSFNSLFYLPEGKEDLVGLTQYQKPHGSDMSEFGYLTSSVQNSQYSFVDDALVGRYVLPSNDARRAAAGIPVVVTTKEAVTLFGKRYSIPAEPTEPKARIAWMRNLQDKLNGVTYTACYRNQADISQILKANQTALEMVENKSNPDYVRPKLVYGLPASACGDLVVKEDHRTAEERAAEQKQATTNVQLGLAQAPQHQLLKFTVVGVMPVQPQDDMFKSLPAFVTGILSANYGQGAIIPRQMYQALPASVRADAVLLNHSEMAAGAKALVDAGLTEHVVEFRSVAQARAFLAQGCAYNYTGDCKKPFVLQPYAANYVLLDDLNALAAKVLRVALPVALGLAGIIIGFTMVRVMIDSRRETAVFRAIGAKRRDIVAVYLLYSLLVALQVLVFSFALGLVVAGGAQLYYGNDVTTYARVAYGLYDSPLQFEFIGMHFPLLAGLAAGIVGISLVAVTPPLIRNVRRSPITDMRDE